MAKGYIIYDLTQAIEFCKPQVDIPGFSCRPIDPGKPLHINVPRETFMFHPGNEYVDK